MIRDYTTFDGQRLSYRHWPASAPRATLVYVHGIESHGGWFDETARQLTEGRVEVYAPDRRGSGQNWLGRGHCRAYEHLLTDLLLFLDQVASSAPVHLLGLSWGAKVAFAFAQQYPERLGSLILLTPGIWPRQTLPPAMQARIFWRWVRNSQRRVPVPLSPDLFSERPSVRDYISGDPQRVVAVTPGFLWESRRLDRLVQAASRCPVPLCCLLARYDRIIDTRRTEQWVAQLTVPRARTTIHDAGHALQLECPIALADDLLQWIAEGSA